MPKHLTNTQILKRLMDSPAGPLAQVMVMCAVDEYIKSVASETEVKDSNFLSMTAWVQCARILAKDLAKMRGEPEPVFEDCIVIAVDGERLVVPAG